MKLIKGVEKTFRFQLRDRNSGKVITTAPEEIKMIIRKRPRVAAAVEKTLSAGDITWNASDSSWYFTITKADHNKLKLGDYGLIFTVTQNGIEKNYYESEVNIAEMYSDPADDEYPYGTNQFVMYQAQSQGGGGGGGGTTKDVTPIDAIRESLSGTATSQEEINKEVVNYIKSHFVVQEVNELPTTDIDKDTIYHLMTSDGYYYHNGTNFVRIPTDAAMPDAAPAYYVNSATGEDKDDEGWGTTTDKPFKTIQYAYNFVAKKRMVTDDVTRIQIAPGTYNEMVNISDYNSRGGRIYILGQTSDPEDVIVDSGGRDSFNVSSCKPVLIGFITVKQTINVEHAKAILENNIFEDLELSSSVFVDDSYALVRSCQVKGNNEGASFIEACYGSHVLTFYNTIKSGAELGNLFQSREDACIYDAYATIIESGARVGSAYSVQNGGKLISHHANTLEEIAPGAEGLGSYSKNSQIILDNGLARPFGFLEEATMIGATATEAGDKGWVPAPQAGDQDKVLKGDGHWGEVGESGNAYSRIYQIDDGEDYLDYIYDVYYEKVDYDYAEKYFRNYTGNISGGCAAMSNGDYTVKFHDWKYDNSAEFLVHTPGDEGSYAVIGVATEVPGLDNETVKSHAYNEAYKIVPFMLTDGMNSAGLRVVMNVVPKDKGDNHSTEPHAVLREEVHVRMLPRYILDKYADAEEAASYIYNFVSVFYNGDSDYEAHFMISDRNGVSKAIEFVNGNNRTLTLDVPCMTNFHLADVTLNDDNTVYTPETKDATHTPTSTNGITDHGMGLERFNIMVGWQPYLTTGAAGRGYLQDYKYTSVYTSSGHVANPYW